MSGTMRRGWRLRGLDKHRGFRLSRGSTPSPSFKDTLIDCVHDAIYAKLAKSMIIRLLGKSISYHALWSMIMALWNSAGEINLIDLDNKYYLVRFANKDDFHKVLSGSP
ncbi:hypothetical protein V6N13_008027 [Hibiscus sabdariffa]